MVIHRIYLKPDANMGEGLIMEGTVSGTNGIDLLENLIKQDSLGDATNIDWRCFIRKDTCKIEKKEIELEVIDGKTFNTKDDDHSDNLKDLDLWDENSKRFLSSWSYEFGREKDFEFLEGYCTGNIRGRFEWV